MMRTLFLATLTLAGCNLEDDPDLGGQFGEESGASCQAVDATPLGVDEVSSLGFSPGEVLALVEGPHVETLEWLELGGTTEVTVEVTHDGGAMELVDYEVVEEGDLSTAPQEEPAIAMSCPDAVEIEVTFSVVTADGELDEVWTGRLIAETATGVSARHPLDETSGSFDPWDHVPDDSEYEFLSSSLELSFDEQGSWGTVRAQGEGGDRSDPDGAVWAENLELGVWAPEGAEQ